MAIQIKGNDWLVEVESTVEGIYVKSGFFGQVRLEPSEIFTLRLKDCNRDRELRLTSRSAFGSVKTEQSDGKIDFYFSQYPEVPDVSVTITASYDETGISWTGDVQNHNQNWSAMELSYPTPILMAKDRDFFEPAESGQVIHNIGNDGVFAAEVPEKIMTYPSRKCCMQYFAVYGQESGIYLGIHDGSAASKEIRLTCPDGKLGIGVRFYGIGASLVANSFALRGSSRWQILHGDWYDASMIYSSFVQKEASWLPQTGVDGRPDTENRYKDIAFWVMDAMPNTPEQGENCPKNLTSDSDKATPDYWYERPIQLKKELGIPIAYHIYNWHETPFNLDYPHYHAKKEFLEKREEFRENGLYVMPYINAVSWEMLDAEEGYEVNYANTGKYGVVIKEDGFERFSNYPQVKKSGEGSHLAPICPTFRRWWEIMDEVSRYLVDDLKVEGVYYDQVSAHAGFPCYSKTHGHLPGGGSYWAEEYTAMMQKIRERKNHGFCFSECNAEPYMKGFDGYLTWTWVCAGEVPAFSAVYAGYIVMLGRNLDGTKKEDDAYFRYAVARSLLFGQQIGWCKSDVFENEKKIGFLKTVVKIRHDYATFFRSSRMCRPPKVTSSGKATIASPALWYKTPIKMEPVEGAAWRSYDGTKVVIFLTNSSEKELQYNFSFLPDEYGVNKKNLPDGFCFDGKKVTATGAIPPLSCLTWTLAKE